MGANADVVKTAWEAFGHQDLDRPAAADEVTPCALHGDARTRHVRDHADARRAPREKTTIWPTWRSRRT